MERLHSISTEEIIIGLFCRIDDQMHDIPRHPQAQLHPSELVTLAVLATLRGGSQRRFYQWLCRDWRCLFPHLPDRTRLIRAWAAHRGWTERFLAQPTVLGLADTFGIEFLHPRREHRSKRQLGRKGLSNHRWIVGGKLCVVLNRWGHVCAWDCATANVADNTFQPLIARFDGRMIVLTDSSFHRAGGDVPNLKVCRPRTWKERWLIETMLSLVTRVQQLKKMTLRNWRYFQTRLSFALAGFNLLAQWNGQVADPDGVVHLTIADLAL